MRVHKFLYRNLWTQLPIRVDIQTNNKENKVKEHRDTAPTPTSLRREELERKSKNAFWWNDKAVNEWCGWRMSIKQVPRVREFDASQQVWS